MPRAHGQSCGLPAAGSSKRREKQLIVCIYIRIYIHVWRCCRFWNFAMLISLYLFELNIIKSYIWQETWKKPFVEAYFLVFIRLPLKITYKQGKNRYKFLLNLRYTEESYLMKHKWPTRYTVLYCCIKLQQALLMKSSLISNILL